MQLGPMSITKLSPNWACQMGPIHCPKFLLSGEMDSNSRRRDYERQFQAEGTTLTKLVGWAVAERNNHKEDRVEALPGREKKIAQKDHRQFRQIEATQTIQLRIRRLI